MMRDITGYGSGRGPFIGFHDAFPTQGDTPDAEFDVAAGGWLDFLPGMDRVALDTHPYLCFSAPNNDGLSYQAAKVRFRYSVCTRRNRILTCVHYPSSPAHTGARR